MTLFLGRSLTLRCVTPQVFENIPPSESEVTVWAEF